NRKHALLHLHSSIWCGALAHALAHTSLLAPLRLRLSAARQTHGCRSANNFVKCRLLGGLHAHALREVSNRLATRAPIRNTLKEFHRSRVDALAPTNVPQVAAAKERPHTVLKQRNALGKQVLHSLTTLRAMQHVRRIRTCRKQ